MQKTETSKHEPVGACATHSPNKKQIGSNWIFSPRKGEKKWLTFEVTTRLDEKI